MIGTAKRPLTVTPEQVEGGSAIVIYDDEVLEVQWEANGIHLIPPSPALGLELGRRRRSGEPRIPGLSRATAGAGLSCNALPKVMVEAAGEGSPSAPDGEPSLKCNG